MTSLIAYQKVTDSLTTHALRLPEPKEQGARAAQELATLPDGRTVVVLFDGYELPDAQPDAIQGSIEVLPSPMPDDLKSAIREASPHARLISARMQERIRARYSQEDELKFSRIGTGHALGIYKMTDVEKAALVAFGEYLESCRAWAKSEREALGI